MSKTILIVLFALVASAICQHALQSETMGSTQRNGLYSYINALRASHCLPPLVADSNLQNQALTQARTTAQTLSGVRVDLGYTVVAKGSTTKRSFSQVDPRANFGDKSKWNCAADTCTGGYMKCNSVRNFLNGKATRIGCAGALSRTSTGLYIYVYICRVNKNIPTTPVAGLLSPGKCSGSCSAPAPAPATPAPAPATPAPSPATPAPAPATPAPSPATPAPAPATPAPAPATPAPAPATPAPSPATPAPSPSTPSTEPEMWVDRHNAARGSCVGPVQWDSSLASAAQQWVDYLVTSNGCNMKHATSTQRNGKGENIYKVPYGPRMENIKSGVDMWALEKKAYNCATKACASGVTTPVPLPPSSTGQPRSFTWTISSCGHFTQVVWKKTTHIGCAVRQCTGSNSVYYMGVCRYSPPGNMGGRHPFDTSNTYNSASDGASFCAACDPILRASTQTLGSVDNRSADSSSSSGFFSDGTKVGLLFGLVGTLIVVAVLVVVLIVVVKKANNQSASSDYVSLN